MISHAESMKNVGLFYSKSLSYKIFRKKRCDYLNTGSNFGAKNPFPLENPELQEPLIE